MDCLALENQSSVYDHLSTFLEEFQDKNSHLFPSSDLTSLDVTSAFGSNNNLSCGSKRSRETSYDAFSSWNEDLLTDGLEVTSTINSPCNNNTKPSVKQEIVAQKEERAVKKRKLSEKEELSIFMDDARSRSPPFQTLDFDYNSISNLEALCTPLPPAVIPSTVLQKNNSCRNNFTVAPASSKKNTTPVLCSVVDSIGKLDDNVRLSMMASLKRLATRAEGGRNPLLCPQPSTPSAQVDYDIDYLTMQTLFGAPPTVTSNNNATTATPAAATIVKSERANASFYPTATASAAGIPFVLNVPYAIPPSAVSPASVGVVPKLIDTTSAPKQPSLAAYTNMFVANQCTNPLIYPNTSSSKVNMVKASQNFVSAQSYYSKNPVRV